MSDPTRISEIIEIVETMWRLYPDMRLGQLLCNVADNAEVHIWDLEDDTLLREMRGHLRRAPRAIEAGSQID
ncbi:MAG: DUF1040 family protein [Planctomycetes bacterium]|nr:DUF1040 family protein [Planctomycetota bacterium]